MKKLELSIRQILDLKTINDSSDWLDLYVLEKEFYVDINVNNESAKQRIRTEDKIIDRCFDNRYRSLEIMFFDEIPFLIYQNNGKGGSYCNVFVINKQVMMDCLKFLMELSLDNMFEESQEACISQIISVDAYGMDLKIENEELIAYDLDNLHNNKR